MNIYSVIHHMVDKLPARDEAHLRDLHDTVTAHELGFSSLEELREEQRLQGARIDPAQAAAAWEAAQQLLAGVKAQQEQITRLLETAELGRKAAEERAAAAAAEAATQAAPAAPGVSVFPQTPRSPAEGPAPAIPIAGPGITGGGAPSVAELEAALAAARAREGGA